MYLLMEFIPLSCVRYRILSPSVSISFCRGCFVIMSTTYCLVEGLKIMSIKKQLKTLLKQLELTKVPNIYYSRLVI